VPTKIDSEEPTLRFSIDMLREAGTELGDIQGAAVPQRVTFEELAERAEKLSQCADKIQQRVTTSIFATSGSRK
jgi:hypothetical protein